MSSCKFFVCLFVFYDFYRHLQSEIMICWASHIFRLESQLVVYTTDDMDPRFVAGEDMNEVFSSSSFSSEEDIDNDLEDDDENVADEIRDNEAADVTDEVHMADHDHDNAHVI